MQLEKDLAERARRKRENRLKNYIPYPKQIDFHAAGKLHRERLFMAGNQLGKTMAGAAEMAIHATGLYPDWWQGRKFDKPIRAWVAGVTGENTRDNAQRLLIGEPGAEGTGMLPKAAIHKRTNSRGLPDAVDTVLVKHKSGGLSQISFKSYEKGREKWQGESLDLVWYDEEPPLDIYTEGTARLSARRGIEFLTFTPLLGMSDVVLLFYREESPARHMTRMEIDDARHISAEEREIVIAGYPTHEREARARGIPMLGSGRVFPVEESQITEEPIRIPPHWPRLVGMDFGWDHPTAAVWLAWDRDADTVHVCDAYRQREAPVSVHASAVRARGDWIPVAWPHDGLQHDKGSGKPLAEQYRKEGLKMLPERAQFADGSYGVEAGIMEMLTRMSTSRLKVFSTLADWWEEFRLYHRKDGRIVKVRDDLLSATRYGIMMLEDAKTGQQVRDWKRPIQYPEGYFAGVI